ncbi:MAG TPA: pyridoxamine 5'-phosphate oxidase family protein [Dehalococcoidia bacterium]|nr:pyridoxamine 5'-phosphate oxidase family protein [Dehalococcoidia bacterium]
MTEYGELIAKKLTAKLPEDKLKERIATMFKEQTMCVIATASSDGQPRATPLECFAEGITLYIFADPGTKIENIKVNPKVSVTICNQLKPSWKGDDWKTHKAIKITGLATILEPDEPESIHTRKEVIHWQEFVGALGRDTTEPPKGLVIKVEPKKIEYSESELMTEGYSSKQIWEAPA